MCTLWVRDEVRPHAAIDPWLFSKRRLRPPVRPSRTPRPFTPPPAYGPAHGRLQESTRVAFILRGDGRGLAVIGGFLQVGEAAEAGVRREVLEETGQGTMRAQAPKRNKTRFLSGECSRRRARAQIEGASAKTTICKL